MKGLIKKLAAASLIFLTSCGEIKTPDTPQKTDTPQRIENLSTIPAQRDTKNKPLELILDPSANKAEAKNDRVSYKATLNKDRLTISYQLQNPSDLVQKEEIIFRGEDPLKCFKLCSKAFNGEQKEIYRQVPLTEDSKSQQTHKDYREFTERIKQIKNSQDLQTNLIKEYITAPNSAIDSQKNGGETKLLLVTAKDPRNVVNYQTYIKIHAKTSKGKEYLEDAIITTTIDNRPQPENISDKYYLRINMGTQQIEELMHLETFPNTFVGWVYPKDNLSTWNPRTDREENNGKVTYIKQGEQGVFYLFYNIDELLKTKTPPIPLPRNGQRYLMDANKPLLIMPIEKFPIDREITQRFLRN